MRLIIEFSDVDVIVDFVKGSFGGLVEVKFYWKFKSKWKEKN